ncbi:histone deacetylase family protein [Runella slithyformis]|uniref:Histone deacetylase superfamily n=1 Tax=Runella slithyformis (strain ATCC 29530 / DSM 19594 / LMG 11500 / NCIMB 11436 / LSU 4) TaxID=761193 RepID=A0A7U3ZMI0_RUNSL|nr:histone deacetylase [Runella slithyformis]AEI49939.1 histone deacetylase superfamily [Runella slithyformis DSM 19594]
MLHIAFDPIYCHPLPVGPNGEPHRFPMLKYELIPEQLLYEGSCTSDNFFSPGTLDERWILDVHTRAYWEDLKQLRISEKMVRRIGFPLSARLIERETRIAQGTIECTHHALTHGVSMNVAGGTHHAYADRGEGFCLLNDVAIAANYLLKNKSVSKILVIDLDVHQGNGTAVIFQNEPRVFTFSMHGKDNYPLHKEVSDLDIALPTGTQDEEYLQLLTDTLPALIKAQKPDFAFYISGVDILGTDKLGKLKVSLDGCRQRDEFVFAQCQTHHIPVAVSIGGGYSPRIADIVEAHCNTFRVAQRMYF